MTFPTLIENLSKTNVLTDVRCGWPRDKLSKDRISKTMLNSGLQLLMYNHDDTTNMFCEFGSNWSKRARVIDAGSSLVQHG